jgi:hypothetical protein
MASPVTAAATAAGDPEVKNSCSCAADSSPRLTVDCVVNADSICKFTMMRRS